MRYVKDSPLELGHRVWQLRPPQPSLIVVVKGTFDAVEGDPAPFAEEQVPATGEVHWENDAELSLRTPSDFSLMKPRGECFVVGKAWAPGGRAAAAVACSFKIGPVEKSFGVFGDRRWTPGLVRRLTDPERFTEMELRMERAYGGRGHAPNPYGRGRDEVEGATFAPNLEQTRDPVQSPSHKVDPVIVGPLPVGWPARMKHAGTYDQRYMDERWPWLPVDLDWRFFLEAPPDQQLREGYWRGDERIELHGLHPKQPSIRSRLPAIAPRVFLDLRPEGQEPRFLEMTLKLDTVTWDAEIGKLLLTWRAQVEIKDEQLEDLPHIFVAHDPLGGPKRSPEELQARCAAILAAEEEEEEDAEGEDPPEEDEAPPPAAPDAEEEEEEDAEDEPSPEDVALDAKIADFHSQLAAAGLKLPDPTAEPAPAPEPAALLERMKASGNPVSPELEEMVASMNAPLADEAEEEPPPVEPESPPVAEGRDLIEARIAAGEPLTELDLTGADLSNMDLSGQDLSGSILARTDLTQTKLISANLSGCDLSEAILIRAELSKATLVDADLTGANLKWVDLLEAVLEDATLDEACLVQARLAGVKAARAELTGADLTEAILTKGDFTEADFEGANLSRVDATEAMFKDATLEQANADGANFDRAVMTQMRGEGLVAREARFGAVDAEDSFWEHAELSKSDFSFARLTRADFSDAVLINTEMDGCLLRGARFDRANAHSIRARKADLMEASLESADFSFADLRGANLFGAGLWRTTLSDAQLELANVTRTMLEG